MVLNDVERVQLLEVLNEVRSFVIEMHEIENIFRKQLMSADSVVDFVSRVQNEHDGTSDSVLRTDLRICLGRLRKRMRG